MFGVICAGRPVQVNLQQVDQGKFVLQIPNGAKVNHLVVFLLPEATIPMGMAASVYFQVPGKGFDLLGALTETKSSAIFRINGNVAAGVDNDMDDRMVDEDSVEQYDINIGISIEPLEEVQQALAQKASSKAMVVSNRPAASTQPADAGGIERLANQIVSHAYNYLGGFTGADGKVSMRVFDDWWNKFKQKLAVNPKFLDNLD